MTNDKSKRNAVPSDARARRVTSDARWQDVVSRRSNADGLFFYSVETTGVYCRPSCGARLARPENVAFHRTTAEAERAGFRACKRCKPDQPPLAERQAAQVAALCRLIETSDEVPSLEQLAEHAGLGVFHVHRMFKAVTGLTPKAYAAGLRAREARAALGTKGATASVTEAIYRAGYRSSGRFYERSNEILGMMPTTFKAGGANEKIRFAVGECSLGSILVAATERGVCAVLLGDDPNELTHDLERRFPQATLIGGDHDFERVVAQMVGLVEDPRRELNLPLDIRGTALQERVWKALRAVPAGGAVTYTELAAKIGAPGAVRAVASACAANPVAVAIPCHRVIRRDGELAGYRWGVERKRALLERERES
jgi:AraC family transcriptional regulator of adaptative response/methylated-DNA-[protein]-cysteine methyltransferase